MLYHDMHPMSATLHRSVDDLMVLCDEPLLSWRCIDAIQYIEWSPDSRSVKAESGAFVLRFGDNTVAFDNVPWH